MSAAILDSRELKLGETFTTTLDLLLVIPEDEIAATSQDGVYGDDVWKPRTFDEWIRQKFQADALSRAMNSQLAAEGKTSRVEVDRCEVLSTRPAMSEKPELRGTGVGVQRAEIRVSITPVHNELFTVTALLVILAASLFLVVTRSVLDKIAEVGPRILGGLGTGAAQLGLGLVALGVGLAFLLSKAK